MKRRRNDTAQEMADNLSTQNTSPLQKTPYATQNEIAEIDLLQLFFELKKNLLKIILAAIIGGVIAGAYSRFMIVPKYKSTAMMYVLSKETTLTSLADLQIGSQLTNDYKTIVTSRPVLENVAEKLDLNYGYKRLAKKISISNPQNTRIITITAEDPNPQMAKKIADTVATISADMISDIMEMVPPKMIEPGEIPISKSSPSNGKNAALGAIAGIIAACIWIIWQMLMNDSIKTTEDVNNTLGISVLASIPERAEITEEEINEKSFGHKKKGKK